MSKSSAANSATSPVANRADQASLDEWDEDEAFSDLASFMGNRAQQARVEDRDELTEALAAEMASRSRLGPIDLRTGRPVVQPVAEANEAYDPWDDDALERLADELSGYQDFDPEALPEGVLPPHSPEEQAAAPHRVRRRAPFVIGAAALALVITGAIGWSLIGGPTRIGEPQIVRAPDGPFKVVPEPGESNAVTVESDIVFTTASGLPPKGEERLVTRAEEVPALPGVTPQVNRVILPDGSEVAPEPLSPADFGPRRVRTVLVKPDGTIIDAPDNPAPSRRLFEDPLLAPTTVTTTSSPEPAVEVASLDPSIAPNSGSAEDFSSSAGLPPIPESEQVLAAAPAVELSPSPDPTGTIGEPEAAAESEIAPPMRVPPTRPANVPATTASLPSAAQDGPLDLAATAAAPQPAAPQEVAALAPAQPAAPVVEAAPAVAAAPPGSAFVQLASQRSEDAALSTFQSLQRKFPGLLDGMAPDIQRADLGAKGVYYRVRVAQPSRDAAAGLCQSLRSAGGDCLVARN